jgi:GT2 family glycosyltransferase
MRISIIIPTYNNGRFIPRLIDSLHAQTCKNFQVIFVDDGSTDDTVNIIKSHVPLGWVNYFRMVDGNGDAGYGWCCNVGARAANGDFFLFLNPDVWLDKSCLGALCCHGPNGVIFCRELGYSDSDSRTQIINGIDLFGGMVESKSDFPRHVFCAGYFIGINKELFSSIGGFDKNFFLTSEELDICWRAILCNSDIKFANGAIIHHTARAVRGYDIERRYLMNRNRLLTILKNSDGPLLILFVTALMLFAVQALVFDILHFKVVAASRCVIQPLKDLWRLRKWISSERKRIKSIRTVSDWTILWKFWKPWKYAEFKYVVQLLKFGMGDSGIIQKIAK